MKLRKKLKKKLQEAVVQVVKVIGYMISKII